MARSLICIPRRVTANLSECTTAQSSLVAARFDRVGESPSLHCTNYQMPRVSSPDPQSTQTTFARARSGSRQPESANCTASLVFDQLVTENHAQADSEVAEPLDHAQAEPNELQAPEARDPPDAPDPSQPDRQQQEVVVQHGSQTLEQIRSKILDIEDQLPWSAVEEKWKTYYKTWRAQVNNCPDAV